MDINAEELNKLMARLLNSNEQARKAAREEIQAWPIETAGAIINFAAKQEQERTKTRSQQIRNALQRWWPTHARLRFPTPYDWLVIVYAEQAQDARFLKAVLNVLARNHAFRKSLRWLASDEERDGPSPYWSSGIMMKQPPIRIPIEGAGHGYYRLFERPLLSALLRLLPQMESHNRTLTSEEQQTLLHLLRFPYRDVELTLCLLDFLTTAGDSEAIEPVELIERTAIATENGKRLRAASQLCLEQVRCRAKRAFQSQTLLRSANDDSLAAPDTLLRPLENKPADQADELLRPQARMKDEG